MYNDGVDMIFVAAGESGSGVIKPQRNSAHQVASSGPSASTPISTTTSPMLSALHLLTSIVQRRTDLAAATSRRRPGPRVAASRRAS